jgi:hypothetical protein
MWSFPSSYPCAKQVSGAPGQPWLPGHILAQKNYTVRRPPPGPEFQIKFVPEEYLLKQGLPRGTPWTVFYKDLEFDKPATNVFEIWINDDLQDDLHRLEDTAAGRMLWGAVMSDVLFDLVQRYFQVEGPEAPSDQNGLQWVLKRLIEEGLALSLPEARNFAKQPGGPQIRARVQALLQTCERIKRAGGARGAK